MGVDKLTDGAAAARSTISPFVPFVKKRSTERPADLIYTQPVKNSLHFLYGITQNIFSCLAIRC